MNKNIISILLFLTVFQTMMGQESTTYRISMGNDSVPVSVQAADQAYVAGQYVQAIDMYQEIIDTKGVSASLYLNLGNAYYKTDNLAQALINYERAILLDPTDQDIRFNLELARSKCVDKTTQPNVLFITAFAHKLSNLLNINQWGSVVIICFAIAMILLAVFFVIGGGNRFRNIYLWSAVIMILISITSWIIAGSQKHALANHEYAIVTAPSVTVRSTPSEQGTEIVIVHEGYKVKVVDKTSMKQWMEIKLDDGNVGWIESGMIEII